MSYSIKISKKVYSLDTITAKDMFRCRLEGVFPVFDKNPWIRKSSPHRKGESHVYLPNQQLTMVPKHINKIVELGIRAFIVQPSEGVNRFSIYGWFDDGSLYGAWAVGASKHGYSYDKSSGHVTTIEAGIRYKSIASFDLTQEPINDQYVV